MFWQREYVRENVSFALNETFKVDLPQHGLLGALLFRISGNQISGYGEAGGDWRIIDKISKIELIGNGSEIIKSLTGYQAQALAYWDQGVIPPGDWRNYATNTQFEYLLLNLGRFLYDGEIGLDLAKWNNVELRITNTATSSHFTSLTLSILGYYLRESRIGSFPGYMRTEEWRAWTTVADETKYNDLPVEHVIRRILLQATPDEDNTTFLDDTSMANLMDDIELSLDTGQIRVYKGGLDDLMRENYLDWGHPMIVGASPYHNADVGIRMSLGRPIGYANGAGSQDGAGAATINTFETVRSGSVLKAETKEADSPSNLLAVGMSPFETGIFRFDTEWDPNTWLDPNQRKTVKLDIHTRNAAASADGRNAIVLDRLVLR